MAGSAPNLRLPPDISTFISAKNSFYCCKKYHLKFYQIKRLSVGTAILTGASGFIGARLVQKLLKKGWDVHALGRGKDGTSFEDRVKAALCDIDGQHADKFLLQKLYYYEVDICKTGLGISKSMSMYFAFDNAVLFHLAGDTSFVPVSKEAQRLVNITGSLNVIKSLQDSLTSVVHVSTAYVAGDRPGKILESDLDVGQSFRNSYEKSKLDAEIAITDLCNNLELPLTIVRPSIITNDTATGRSSTLTHLNALVEVISRIQKHHGIDDGEVVGEEIRIPVAPYARPNLAPVDPIVEALLEIGVNSQAVGKTYHLCHPDPQPNSEIVSLVAEAFGVKDKLRLPFVSELPDNPNWTERMLLRSLKQYLPYLNDFSVFDLTNTKSIIPDYDSRFVPINPDYLRKVIDFQRSEVPRVNKI
jgi:nucleoside-diphosphate-sugar epimerase